MFKLHFLCSLFSDTNPYCYFVSCKTYPSSSWTLLPLHFRRSRKDSKVFHPCRTWSSVMKIERIWRRWAGGLLYSIFRLLFVMGISPCCFFSLFPCNYVCMFRLGQVQNGSKPKSRWVRVSAKANSIWNLDPNLSSLFLSLSLYYLLMWFFLFWMPLI